MRAPLTAAFVTATLALLGCSGAARPTLAPEPAPSSTTAPPQLADVHVVIRRGLSALQSFRADVAVTRSGVPDDDTWATVEWTAQGLVKETAKNPRSERTFFYDGREGRRVWYTVPSAGFGTPSVRVERGLDVGVSPIPAPSTHYLGPDPVGLARQVLGWSDARVSRERVDGRAAWVVQYSTPGTRPELQVVTVDDLTGLALRVDAVHAGQPDFQVRVENLTTDLADEPSFALPDGVPVTSRDQGFGRTSLEEARRAASYPPVMPAWLPAGFVQAEVMFRPSLEPLARSIVSVAFRRGMDLVVLTTREAAATEPVAPPGRTVSRSVPEDYDPPPPRFEPVRVERVTLASGAFAGVEAERSAGDLGRSSLTASDGSFVLGVRGDITPEDITRLAESLQPIR